LISENLQVLFEFASERLRRNLEIQESMKPKKNPCPSYETLLRVLAALAVGEMLGVRCPGIASSFDLSESDLSGHHKIEKPDDVKERGGESPHIFPTHSLSSPMN
jgi:hypothetical protein